MVLWLKMALATMASASPIDGAIQRKMNGQRAVRSGKRIILVILNEDMDDVISIVKSVENSGVLINGVSETVKHKIENKT